MSDFPSTIYIAIGAIIAALITSGLSFVNLIISKEQKTSEFRQQWIDSLREDISAFIGLTTSLKTSWLFYEDKPAKKRNNFIKENIEIVGKSNEIATRIILRLNRKKHNHFCTIIEEFIKSISSPQGLQSEGFQKFLDKITVNAQTILKHEWERVKRGEEAYTKTKHYLKWLVIFVVSILIIAIFIA